MDSRKGMVEMAVGSWLIAFAGGTLAGTLLWILGGWGFLQGAFVGFLVFIIVGGILSWIMTRPLPAPVSAARESTAKADADQKAATAAPAAAPAPKVKPSKDLPGQAELAARKPDWKYEKEAPKAAPAKKKAAKKAAPKASADDAGRPAYFSQGPDGAADDLKKISGVGPKLEQTLNDLGIWHYEQVAKFKKKDIAWVDERLRFKGRIERDDWVGQAKALAKTKG